MIAIAVMTIGIVGIYAIVPRIISIISINSNRFIAAQLAREGIEIIRNIRDSNWLGELDWRQNLIGCAGGCEIDHNDDSPVFFQNRFLKTDSNGFYNYELGENTRFKRKITITENPDILDIEVEIIWSGKYSPLIVQEQLYNWR